MVEIPSQIAAISIFWSIDQTNQTFNCFEQINFTSKIHSSLLGATCPGQRNVPAEIQHQLDRKAR